MQIALVHDDPTPNQADLDTETFLEAAGHTVTMVVETSSPPAEGTYDLIIISESGSGSSVAPYDTYGDPVMVWETTWNSLRLSSGAATSQTSSTQVDLVGHSITTGLPDPLTYQTSATSTYGVATSSLPAGVEVVATDISVATHAFAIVADAGATLTSGTAPARRAAMGLISSRPSNLTTDGQSLVLAIVDWLTGAGSGPNLGDATGGHAWSGQAVGSNRPAVPTGLQAVAVSASQIDLSWDAVSGVSGYDVERDGQVILVDHASTSYSDTGLDPSTEYAYRVRAVS